jgi:hypothetical protein
MNVGPTQESDLHVRVVGDAEVGQVGSRVELFEAIRRDRRIEARGAGGDGIPCMRCGCVRGLVAHGEVPFGATGEPLAIRQDSFDWVSHVGCDLLKAPYIGHITVTMADLHL